MCRPAWYKAGAEGSRANSAMRWRFPAATIPVGSIRSGFSSTAASAARRTRHAGPRGSAGSPEPNRSTSFRRRGTKRRGGATSNSKTFARSSTSSSAPTTWTRIAWSSQACPTAEPAPTTSRCATRRPTPRSCRSTDSCSFWRVTRSASSAISSPETSAIAHFFVVNGGRDPLYPTSAVEPSLEQLRKGGVQMVYKPQPEAGHDTSWWPQVKDAFEDFVREHPRNPLPDRLTWESSDTRAWGRMHWLVLDSIGSRPDEPQEPGGSGLQASLPLRADRPRAKRQCRGGYQSGRRGVHAAVVARPVRFLTTRQSDHERPRRVRTTRRKERRDADEVGRTRQRSDDAVRGGGEGQGPISVATRSVTRAKSGSHRTAPKMPTSHTRPRARTAGPL